ncbi:MAG: carbohydrate kinase family protein [Oscillospiraceae bacterium]|jgi:sugar/nucleoside kinase (ribokinase family)|nr:carbohydrate kinase family protein [Oscillospiraceae bacterium]
MDSLGGKTASNILVAGHICLDITPQFHSGEQDISRLFVPGKLINVGAASIHLGGAVGNTGLAMNFLGADVKLVGKIASDTFGGLVRGILDAHGCGENMIISDSGQTAYTIVIAVPGNDRFFLHNPSENDSFEAQDVSDELMANARHLHFGYPTLMRRMFEDDGAELIKLFRRAKSFGLTTSLDITEVDPNSAAGRANWRKILEKVLPLTDFFLPSIEEICYILDYERYCRWGSRAEGKDPIYSLSRDIKPLAQELLGLGAAVVLLKCGAPGIYYESADGERARALCESAGLNPEQWQGRAGFAESFHQSVVKNATGAGDTAIAAFLTAMTRGYSLERCVTLSAATGACCVSEYDALSGLKSFDTLERLISDGWERNNICILD